MSEKTVITTDMRNLVRDWRAEPMVFEVEKGAIKRFAQVIGDSNPLWTDENQARKSRYGGLVAMPVFLMNFNPFQSGVAFPFRPLPGSASAGEVFEFYHPMRPGDTITITERIKDIYEKQGKSGPLVFTVDERTFTNQSGQLVAKTNWTRVFYQVPSAPKSADVNISSVLNNWRERLQIRAASPFQVEATSPSTEQLLFDNVNIDTEMPSLLRRLSHELFVRFFAVSNDYSTHHVDYIYAVAEGWRDCIAQGLLGTAFLCKLVTDWIGEDWILRKLEASYRAPGYPGDVWTSKGKVVNKYQANGERLVDCDIWIENQDGIKVTFGKATVVLSS